MTIDEAKRMVAGLLALESKRAWLAAKLDPNLTAHAQATRACVEEIAQALGISEEFDRADEIIVNN